MPLPLKPAALSALIVALTVAPAPAQSFGDARADQLSVIAPRADVRSSPEAWKGLGASDVRPFDEGFVTFELNGASGFERAQVVLGDEASLIFAPNVIVGTAPGAAEVEGLYRPSQQDLGELIAPALVFRPDVLAQVAQQERQAGFSFRVFDQTSKVLSVERDAQAPGDTVRYSLELDRGQAHLSEVPVNPLDPASPRALAGDIVLDGELYRLTPLDGEGRSAMVRVERALTMRDHAEGSARTFEASQTWRCAERPDNLITIGWAISLEAALELERVNSTSALAATPKQISDPIAELNRILDHHGISDIRFNEVRLMDEAQPWRDFSTPDGGYGYFASGATQFEPVRLAAIHAHVDILMLIMDAPDSECGRATILASPSAAYGFVNQRCMFEPRYALPHEVGHMVGGCHEPKFYEAPDYCGPEAGPKDRFAWLSTAAPVGDMMSTWRSPRPHDPNGFRRETNFSNASDAFRVPAKAGANASMNLAAILRGRVTAMSAFGRCRTAFTGPQ